jgi:RNA polymerase sigma factor (sigma-70 family)
MNLGRFVLCKFGPRDPIPQIELNLAQGLGYSLKKIGIRVGKLADLPEQGNAVMATPFAARFCAHSSCWSRFEERVDSHQLMTNDSNWDLVLVNEFPETHISLLSRLRDPVDGTAWSTFVDVYGPLVYGEMRRRGLSHQDAEDLTQEVFRRCLRSIQEFQYDSARGRFRDWLGVVVRNEAFRFWRDRGRKTADAVVIQDSELLEEVPYFHQPEWSDAFQTRILEVALKMCMSRFEPQTWQAFSRVWVDHRSAESVAAELDQPIDWVYVAKSRVLKILRKIVLELADDWPFQSEQFKD